MLDQQSTEIKEYFDATIKPFAEQLALTAKEVSGLKLKQASQAGFNQAISIAGTIGFAILLGLGGWVLITVANIPETIHTQLSNLVTQESLGSQGIQSYQNNK